MRIAVFTDLFLPHVDGVTNSLVHLISEYKALGHEVLVITPKTKGSETVSLPGIKLVFLPSVPSMVYPEFMLGFFSSQLLFTLKSFAPEIVHVIAPGPVGSMGLFYATLVNVKSVATFHGYFMEPEYLRIIGIKKRGVKLAQKFLWRYTKTFYDRADQVITPSQFVKKDLEGHNFARPISVIKNAVDFSAVNQDEKLHQEFVEKYKLSGKKVVLFVGRLSIEKNIEALIRAFSFVRDTVPKAHLLIIGGGPDAERLRELVKEHDLSKHITFTGEISNELLVKRDVFATAHVFATASHSEVQPMSIIEAMHFGLPVVAVKSRGLSEMIQGNGYLVVDDSPKKLAKSMIEILKDSKLQKLFADKSKKLALEYSLEHTAKLHIDLYSNLVANRQDRHFIKYILKLRIIRAFKDFIFSIGILHTVTLVYLFFVKEKIEYLNIFYILDFDKVFMDVTSSWGLFALSSVFIAVTYLFFFYQNGRKN